MPQSPGVLAREEYVKDGEENFQPGPEWVKMVAYHRQRLQLAIQARNSPDRKLDNLTFLQDFYSNEDAANSYLRPKRNDDEVRVVGGTTEKRIESVVNELQSLNYQHEIHAYDDNDADIRGLGRAMEDCVTRTNQLEHDENVCSDAIWELGTQRGVFVEEVLEEKRVGNAVVRQCRKRVRSLLEVIWGDGTMPWYLMQEQPFIATYDRMSLQTLGMFFGHMDNWRYVRGGQDLSTDVYGTDITFRLGILLADECEVVRYMSVPDNEYQIYVNGVPMLEPGTPLPFQYPFPRYPLAYAIPKRMGHHTFIGRSMASSLKYLQALSDETVRNIVRKFRQAIEPPRAVVSNNRIYTRDMYDAGQISYGVNADALKPLTTHDGVTDAETTVMNMVKSMQDEFAARSDAQLGAAPGKKQSATAVVEQQKNAVKMLGQIVLAYTSLVEQWTENRIYNVIESYSRPDGGYVDPSTRKFKEQYRRFTLKDQALDDGKSGTKIVQFLGQDPTKEEHLKISEWEDAQAEEGNPVRLTMLNVRKLREASVNWFVTVASKPKDNDDLHKLMFKDKLEQAKEVSDMTQRQLNGERVIDEYEKVWRVHDWFETKQPMPEAPPDGAAGPPGPGAPPAGGPPPAGSGIGGDLTNGLRAGNRKPQAPSMAPKALMGVK